MKKALNILTKATRLHVLTSTQFKTQVLFQVTLVPLFKGEMGIVSVNTEIRDSKGKPLCGQPFHPNPAVKGLRVPDIPTPVLTVHGNTDISRRDF